MKFFRLDFNAATFGNQVDELKGNNLYAAQNYHDDKQRYYIDDLESLYYMMLNMAGIRLPWQARSEKGGAYKIQIRECRVNKIYLKMLNVANMSTIINRNSFFFLLQMQALAGKIQNAHVRSVYFNFYDYVRRTSDEFFNYDGMHKKINDAIEKIAGTKKKQYFQWIKKSAIARARDHSIPPISKVPGPPTVKRTISLPNWPNQI